MIRKKLLKQSKNVLRSFLLKTFFIWNIINYFFSPLGFSKVAQWTYGASIGLGGTGIQSKVQVDGAETNVERAEGPGTISLFADRIYNDTWSIAIEHIRGFRLGPLSSGLSFTGVGAKWYFWSPIPTYSEVSPESTHLFIQQFSPFVGFTTGIASGSIKRTNDKITSVTGSGVYMGLRGGMDYLLKPGIGLRGESSLSTTFSYSEKPVTTITEFSLRIGIFFFY